MKDKIIIWECFPPIPTDKFNYAAYWYGFEEGDYGWGSSAAMAEHDLLTNYELPEENGEPIKEWDSELDQYHGLDDGRQDAFRND